MGEMNDWREHLTPDDRWRYTNGAVWNAFGLSYSAYLVVPRVVLCSMPMAWQERFVALMNDLHDELGSDWEPDSGYTVLTRERNRYTKDPMRDYRHASPLEPKCLTSVLPESDK